MTVIKFYTPVVKEFSETIQQHNEHYYSICCKTFCSKTNRFPPPKKKRRDSRELLSRDTRH